MIRAPVAASRGENIIGREHVQKALKRAIKVYGWNKGEDGNIITSVRRKNI